MEMLNLSLHLLRCAQEARDRSATRVETATDVPTQADQMYCDSKVAARTGLSR